MASTSASAAAFASASSSAAASTSAAPIPTTLILSVFIDGHVLPRDQRVRYTLINDAVIAEGDPGASEWLDALDGRCIDRTSGVRAHAHERLDQWLYWRARDAHAGVVMLEGRLPPACLVGRRITRVVTVHMLAEGDDMYQNEDSDCEVADAMNATDAVYTAAPSALTGAQGQVVDADAAYMGDMLVEGMQQLSV